MRKVASLMSLTLCLAVLAFSVTASASSYSNGGSQGKGHSSLSRSATIQTGGALSAAHGLPNPSTIYGSVGFPTSPDWNCGATGIVCGTASWSYYGTSYNMWGQYTDYVESYGFNPGFGSMTDLTANWTFRNDLAAGQYTVFDALVYGGNGWNDVGYVYWTDPSCNYCGETVYVSGTVNFADIPPSGLYGNDYWLLLQQISPTIAPGLGSIAWYNGGVTGVSGEGRTPEPASLMLLGSGLLGLGGVIRRRLGK